MVRVWGFVWRLDLGSPVYGCAKCSVECPGQRFCGRVVMTGSFVDSELRSPAFLADLKCTFCSRPT